MSHFSSLSLALNRPGAVSLEQVVASLFANNEQGAWYDPSAANVTWRRNLLTYTEQFDNAAWTKGISTNSPTLTASGVADPLGGNAAQTWLFPQTGGNSQIYQAMPATMGGPLTASIWIKAAAPTQIRFGFYDGAFDQSIVDVGTTWQRISRTRNAGFTSSDRRACYLYTESGTNVSLDIFGAQLERGTTATAYQRIVTPEITYLADVQSQPLLFTDAAGTTPVVGVESPVGLILDKRKGATLGAELVDTANTTAPWVASGAGNNLIAQDGDAVRFTYVDSAYGHSLRLDQVGGLSSNLVVGAWYQFKFKAKINTGSVQLTLNNLAGASATGFPVTLTSTDYTEYTFAYNHVAGGNAFAGFYIYLTFSAGEIVWIKDISVRLLDGNHAYQTGSAARPVLRARYNLLTYSEQFDFTGGGGWSRTNAINMTITANAAVAPDGSTTAEKIRFDAGSPYNLYQNINSATTAGVPYTASVYLRADAPTTISIGFYDNGITRVSTANITTTWTRFTHTATLTKSGPDVRWWFLSQQNGEEFYAWGADLRVGTSAGDYQRIAAATDYATTSTITGQPFRPYLHFVGEDGTGDALQTAALNFTGSDKMTICAGTTRLGLSTNAGVIMEFSENWNNSTGSQLFWTGDNTNGTGNAFNAASRGSAASNANQFGFTATTFAPPTTAVLTAQHDIAGDLTSVRGNGTAGTTGTGDKGSGNWGTYPMHIGRRNGSGSTDFPYRGYLFGLIVRVAASSAGEIAAAESYMAGKTGVTL